MQDNIKVSVIIPVYNTGKYLPACLNSLIKQKLGGIEIICINDGSTDNSGEILKDYAAKDKRIIVIDRVNSGQSAARNYGISIARGEYLGFVDSDDKVDPDWFQKLYAAAKEYDCDIACAGFKKFKNFDGNIHLKYKKYEVSGNISQKISAAAIPNHSYIWNKIYKRSAFLAAGIKFPEGRYFEDLAILLKILYYTGNMVTVPNTYYHYRRRENSTVAISSQKHKDDFELAKREMYDFAKEHNITLGEIKRFHKKEYYKVFGVTVLKIYRYSTESEYLLFGIIPFMKKVIKQPQAIIN